MRSFMKYLRTVAGNLREAHEAARRQQEKDLAELESLTVTSYGLQEEETEAEEASGPSSQIRMELFPESSEDAITAKEEGSLFTQMPESEDLETGEMPKWQKHLPFAARLFAKVTSSYHTDRKLFVCSLVYALTTLDLMALVIRILLFLLTLNPRHLWGGSIYTYAGVFVPFAAWVIATDTDVFSYYNIKKRFLYAFLAHAMLLLVLPVFRFSFWAVLPVLLSVRITPVFTKGMVLFFGQVTSSLLPMAVLSLLGASLYRLMANAQVASIIDGFRLMHYLDTRPNKDTAYDLRLMNEIETGKMQVIREQDRSVHMAIIGNSGTGKTSSVILVAIAQDLNRKIENDDMRQIMLLRMVQEGKAFLKLPDDYVQGVSRFRDRYVIPYPEHEKEYNGYLERYKTCSIIAIGPDNSLSDDVANLCLARGIKPQIVDPTLYDEDTESQKRAGKYLEYLYGMNPFYVPEGLSMDAEAQYILEAARNLAEQLETINIQLNGGGSGDPYFSAVNRNITSVVASIDMLYYPRAQRRPATLQDFLDEINELDNKSKLRKKVQFLEKLFGNVVGIQTGREATDVAATIALAGTESGRKLSETPWNNTLRYAYTRIFNDSGADIVSRISGLQTNCQYFLGDEATKKLLTSEKHVKFSEALEDGEVILLNFGLKHGKTTATSFALSFQLSLNQAVMRRNLPTQPGRYPTPVFEYADELPQYAGQWLNTAISLYRKYNTCMVLALQTLAQMNVTNEMRYLADLIKGVGSLIVFNRASVEEMEIFSKLSGIKDVEEVTTSVSTSSILADAENSYTERTSKSRDAVLAPGDIRQGDFQEVSYFGTQNGRVLGSIKARVHFLPKSEREKKRRKAPDWEKVRKNYPMSQEDARYLAKLAADSSAMEELVRRKREVFDGNAPVEMQVMDVSAVKVEKMDVTEAVERKDIPTENRERKLAPIREVPIARRDNSSSRFEELLDLLDEKIEGRMSDSDRMNSPTESELIEPEESGECEVVGKVADIPEEKTDASPEISVEPQAMVNPSESDQPLQNQDSETKDFFTPKSIYLQTHTVEECTQDLLSALEDDRDELVPEPLSTFAQMQQLMEKRTVQAQKKSNRNSSLK